MVLRRSILIIALTALLYVQSAFALTGREIMDKSEALPESDTAQSKVLMFIHNADSQIEKEFEILSKKYPDDESKTLISFIRPTKIKLLTHTHKNQDDDQWLRLSSGKAKRIAQADKGKPFVNSHYYYEDLLDRDIDDFDYQYTGDDKAVGVDCYKVEAIKKKNRVYSKTILYVRKSDYYIVREDFYKKEKFLKFLENKDVRTVDGILTPFHVVMSLADGQGNTELKVQSVEYNKDVKDSDLSKEALR